MGIGLAGTRLWRAYINGLTFCAELLGELKGRWGPRMRGQEHKEIKKM